MKSPEAMRFMHPEVHAPLAAPFSGGAGGAMGDRGSGNSLGFIDNAPGVCVCVYVTYNTHTHIHTHTHTHTHTPG